MMKKVLDVCVLLLVLAVAGTAEAQDESSETRLTLAVECGGQGQVDDPHRLTVTVENCDTGDETTVTIPVQPQTDSSAIADTLATVLDKKGVSGTTSEETTNGRYGKNSKHKAEDVVIPEGYKVGNVKVEKKPDDEWQCDDGHLQAYIGETQVSNTDDSDQDSSQLSSRRASGFVAPMPTPYDWLKIDVPASNVSELALVLDLYEPADPNGTTVVHSYENAFPPGTTVQEALQELGTYLEDLGMTVLYPTDHQLEAHIAASGLPIVEGSFSAQVLERAPDGETRWVEFSFDLE